LSADLACRVEIGDHEPALGIRLERREWAECLHVENANAYRGEWIALVVDDGSGRGSRARERDRDVRARAGRERANDLARLRVTVGLCNEHDALRRGSDFERPEASGGIGPSRALHVCVRRSADAQADLDRGIGKRRTRFALKNGALQRRSRMQRERDRVGVRCRDEFALVRCEAIECGADSKRAGGKAREAELTGTVRRSARREECEGGEHWIARIVDERLDRHRGQGVVRNGGDATHDRVAGRPFEAVLPATREDSARERAGRRARGDDDGKRRGLEGDRRLAIER
jgi:hypothetical protein